MHNRRKIKWRQQPQMVKLVAKQEPNQPLAKVRAYWRTPKAPNWAAKGSHQAAIGSPAETAEKGEGETIQDHRTKMFSGSLISVHIPQHKTKQTHSKTQC